MNELENIISTMISESPLREEMEKNYFAILNDDPIGVLNFLFTQIAENMIRHDKIDRNIVLIHRLFEDKQFLINLSLDEHNTIKQILKNLMILPNLNRHQLAVIADTYSKITKIYYSNGLAEDLINFLFEIINGDNISLSSNALFSFYWIFHEESIGMDSVMDFCEALLNSNLRSDKYTPKVIPCLKILKYLIENYEDVDYTIFAPDICTLLSTLPPEDEMYLFVNAIESLQSCFFINCFDVLVSIIKSILINSEYSNRTKISLLRFLNDTAQYQKRLLNDHSIDLFQIAQELCTQIDSSIVFIDCFNPIAENAEILIYYLLKRYTQTHNVALLSISELIQSERWEHRYTAVTIVRNFFYSKKYENCKINELIQLLINFKNDPVPACRKNVYESISVLFKLDMRKKYCYENGISSILLDAMIESIALEDNSDCFIAGIKYLKSMIKFNGSEILIDHAACILTLCLTKMEVNSIEIAIQLFMCIRSLTKSLKTHFRQYINDILQYVTSWLASEYVGLRYSAICYVPVLYKTGFKNNELMQHAINSFLELVPFDNMSQKQIIKMYSAFFKCIKILNPPDMSDFDALIDPLITMFEGIKPEITTINDVSQLEEQYGEHIILFNVSNYDISFFFLEEQVDNLSNTYFIFGKAFKHLAPYFVNIVPRILKVIKHHLQVFSKAGFESSAYYCLQSIADKYKELNIDPFNIIHILSEANCISNCVYMIPKIIKLFVRILPEDKDLFDSINPLAFKLLNESRQRLDRYKLKEDDVSLYYFELEDDFEIAIASIFAHFLEKFPQCIDDDYVEQLIFLYPMNGDHNSPQLLIWTQLMLNGQSNNDLLNDYLCFLESQCSDELKKRKKIGFKCMTKLICDEKFAPYISIFIEMILKYCDFENESNNAATIALTEIFRHYPDQMTEQTFSKWLQGLPVDSGNGYDIINVHRYFAQMIKIKESIFLGPMTKDTIEIVLYLYENHVHTDQETRVLLTRFLRSIFSNNELLQHVNIYFNELGEKYKIKLINFARANNFEHLLC